MADLVIRNVSKSYDGRTPILKNVSLHADDGEILTVLGPSGCGKSTLLRVIAGLERADEGDVEIGGTRVNDREPKDRDIAMVFQSYALYPHMSVFDNIAVSLRLRGMPSDKIRERVHATAQKLGIERHLGRRPKELSGGERQRVALARTLVREPKLFLLDEPLSNLDALLRERARAELKTLFTQVRATVVYVTHDQVEAMTLSDRVAVLRAGQAEQVAPPEDIYRRPATVFVAGFVGSPRMNLLSGDILPGSGAHTVGIRPEDVVIAEDGPLEMDVALRETLGPNHLLTLRRGALEVRALIPTDRKTESTLRIRIPLERAHLFDPDGKRLETERVPR
ncbi:MAG: ATP-binding cassette domain-containing protein [Planctomycetes bacterium]|nr:ATP-binding cassette domain-containing protein [Planctomycetota bacterium]